MSRTGRTLSSTSSDDYSYRIPIADLEEYSPTTSSEESVEISNFDRQLETLFDQCSVAISAGKNLIELERMKFAKQQKVFSEQMADKWEALRHEQNVWKNNIESAKTQSFAEDHIVEIDIGGTHLITTSLETLLKIPDSALASMFSGRHPMVYHNDKIFVDRDGEPFIQMIDFLRTSRLPMHQTTMQEIRFIEELDY